MSEMYFLFCLLKKQTLQQNNQNEKGVSQNHFADFGKHLCLPGLISEQVHVLLCFFLYHLHSPWL